MSASILVAMWLCVHAAANASRVVDTDDEVSARSMGKYSPTSSRMFGLFFVAVDICAAFLVVVR